MNEDRRSHERRKFRMAECDGPFFLLTIGMAYEIQTVRDVSTSGLGIRLAAAFKSGDSVTVAYETQEQMYHVKSTVEWCRQTADGSAYDVGIQLHGDDDGSKDNLLCALGIYHAPFEQNVFDDRRQLARTRFRMVGCEGPFFLLAMGKAYEINTVSDISLTGIGLIMPRCIEVQDDVVIAYETQDQMYHVKGMIQWCFSTPGEDNAHFGVKFDHADIESRQMLLAALKSHFDALDSNPLVEVAKEQRHYERKRYFVTDCSGPFFLEVDGKQYPIDTIHDVSVAGIGLEMPHRLNVGQPVEVIYDGMDKRLVAIGAVMWCNTGSSGFYRIGIWFDSQKVAANSVLYLALRDCMDAVNEQLLDATSL
ncbi:MAG: PilZ domain-containing protein [Gammaproteobacteria bacterium]|nr:PilZ domain-containing protein [Gammaproteobacteria bacterium]